MFLLSSERTEGERIASVTGSLSGKFIQPSNTPLSNAEPDHMGDPVIRVGPCAHYHLVNGHPNLFPLLWNPAAHHRCSDHHLPGEGGDHRRGCRLR